MANYDALKAEVANDPLALGYAGKTDVQVAAILNGTSRPTTVARSVVDSWEVYEAIDSTEWAALSAANKSAIQDMLAMGRIRADGARARATFGAVFAAGTASRANLLALASPPVPRTRAQEVFGAAVTDKDVLWARTH